MPGVFVNYRTADNGWAAARVHEALEHTFGRGFLDVRSMPPGSRYPDELRAGIESADVLLVLIGSDWLAAGDDGVRLVDRERDWVREEIEQALARDILIVPVLLDDANLPEPLALPKSIREVIRRQATRLTRRDAGGDLRSLLGRLAQQVPSLLLGRLLEPLPTPGRSPGGLLGAEWETVPFQRADDALDRLLSWVDSPAPVAMRLLTGPAGGGKTRLALELCHRRRRLGWVAGPVARTLTGPVLEHVMGLGVPLLLMVDEAETRIDSILDLAVTAAGSAGGPVRLLLIARSAGLWLRPLSRCTDERVLDLMEDMAEESLPALAPDLATRRAEFRRAVQAYAVRFDRTPEATEPADLGTDLYEQVLELHAAALVAVTADDGRPLRGNPLRALLARETTYQESTAAGLPDPHAGRLDQVVAAATLFGAETDDAARRLLAAVPALADAGTETVRRYATWVRDLYPGPRILEGLRPRPLAEEVVTAHVEVLRTCVAVATPDQLRHAVRFLGGAATRHPDLGGPLTDLIRMDAPTRVPVAVEEAVRLPDGSALLRAVTAVLADDPAGGLDLVDAVLDRLPDRSASLGRYAVEVVRLALSRDAVSAERRAYLEDTLAARLCEVRDWDEAAAAGERAVAGRRALVAGEETRLAAALSNLALARRQQGDADGEQAAAAESVELLRSAGRPGTRALVKALFRLAEASPDRAARVDHTREALAVARGLAPDGDPLVPAALEALGTALPPNDLEASILLEDAVKAYRQLAVTTPDPYRAELARALVNLASRVGARGDLGEARTAATEAARLTRSRGDARTAQIHSAALDLLNQLGTDD